MALGEVCDGNRKDIRNAVEAARKALGWAGKTGHLKSQILYYLGENLDYRKAEFADRIRQMTGVSAAAAEKEVAASIERLFAFGGWADKYDGAVHNVPIRAVSLAMKEPLGVIGIVAPTEAPLLGAISLNCAGYCHGQSGGAGAVRTAPAGHDRFLSGHGNLRRTRRRGQHCHRRCPGAPARFWPITTASTPCGSVARRKTARKWKRPRSTISSRCGPTRGLQYDWFDSKVMDGDYFLAKATQVKNIWVPYGA